MDELERDEQALAEVIRLHPNRDAEDDDALVSTEPQAPGYCRHLRISLNKEAHKTTCRDCGREVDPFAYLSTLAAHWERFATHRKLAEKRFREARERLEEILRLERNARARLKHLDPKSEKAAPQKPWGENAEFI